MGTTLPTDFKHTKVTVLLMRIDSCYGRLHRYETNDTKISIWNIMDNYYKTNA